MFDRSPHRIWLGFSKMAGPKALPALVWFALCCTTLQETLVAPPLYFTNFLYFAHFGFCNYRLCECIDGTGAASLRALCVFRPPVGWFFRFLWPQHCIRDRRCVCCCWRLGLRRTSLAKVIRVDNVTEHGFEKTIWLEEYTEATRFLISVLHRSWSSEAQQSHCFSVVSHSGIKDYLGLSKPK